MESLRKLEDQMSRLINPLRDDMRRLSEIKGGSVVRGSGQQEGVKYSQEKGDFQVPMPMPASYNDWANTNEGFSHMYQSKIPADLSHLIDESGGFSVARAKYEVVALQLQNIESLKLLKEKGNV